MNFMSNTFEVTITGHSMWPTLSDGQRVLFENSHHSKLPIGAIVLARHPLKSGLLIVKRIKEEFDGNFYFIEGDNPDPLASEDSHNFGPVHWNDIIGIHCDTKQTK